MNKKIITKTQERQVEIYESAAMTEKKTMNARDRERDNSYSPPLKHQEKKIWKQELGGHTFKINGKKISSISWLKTNRH